MKVLSKIILGVVLTAGLTASMTSMAQGGDTGIESLNSGYNGNSGYLAEVNPESMANFQRATSSSAMTSIGNTSLVFQLTNSTSASKSAQVAIGTRLNYVAPSGHDAIATIISWRNAQGEIDGPPDKNGIAVIDYEGKLSGYASLSSGGATS